MSTQLHLTVTVDVAGDIPQDVRTDVLQRIDAGQLDLAVLQLLKAEFGQPGDTWRFSLAQTGASFEVTP